MARQHKFRISRDRSLDAVHRIGEEIDEVIMRKAGRYQGGTVEMEGNTLYNFGSCSYLGMDQHPELQRAAACAAFEYGTQFSFSRAYLECGLYNELEAGLERMTGRSIVVAPSTTLAHISALPVLVREKDAVLIDQFAHASLHMASELIQDVPIHTVRHNRMDQVEELVQKLSAQHPHIWLLIDGLYSMSGDRAPFEVLAQLLDRYPQLHLYIDDAHATGWSGTHGRGTALMHLGQYDRVIVALSLNKAFSCAGGALALPNADLKTRIRRCGGPMLFSGPIQPPMLGAAVASAKIHLTEAHFRLQQELWDRIDYARDAAVSAGIVDAAHTRTPIFFIPCDSNAEVVQRVQHFWDAGFYVCPSVFPAVPINRPGIRFTISLHNERGHIDAFMEAARIL
jgi:7-keto-8-aminopelargonate synthetase-like enzyme